VATRFGSGVKLMQLGVPAHQNRSTGHGLMMPRDPAQM
jgi:hypothetical protein